jgi:pimeloyl-ACP methyl ester carboxylesterase
MRAVFEFTLVFALPDADADPASCLDALFEAGCDDAAAGTDRPGMIALDFARAAVSAASAVASAIRDVRRAIRGAELIEIAPDLVNLTDIAGYLGVTKQNVRKYAAGETRRVKAPFPPPVFSDAPNLWIGVAGTSFDSFFGTIFAAHEPRLCACAVISTCLEPGCRTTFEEASPTFKKRFMYISGYTDEAQFDAFCTTLTWEGRVKRIRCPYLRVAGEAEALSPLEHAERPVEALQAPKQRVVCQDSRHSVGNIPAINLGPFPPIRWPTGWPTASPAGRSRASAGTSRRAAASSRRRIDAQRGLSSRVLQR